MTSSGSAEGSEAGSNGVSFTGPGGWGAKITGRDAVLLLILTLALGAMVWSLDRRLDQQNVDHKAMLASQQAIQGEIAFQTYINTFPEGARPRVSIPPGFSQRIMGYPSTGGDTELRR